MDGVDKIIGSILAAAFLGVAIFLLGWVVSIIKRAARAAPKSLDEAARVAGKVAARAEKSMKGAVDAFKDGKNSGD